MRSTLQSLKARRGQNEKGFTLIELLVVVVIIGVLIAIAIPLYLNYQKSSHDKATASDVRNAIVVAEQCFTDKGVYPPSTDLTSGSTAKIDLATACGGTSAINLSDGTEIQIVNADTSYQICGHNKSGHDGQWYNFDSAAGGDVKAGDSNVCAGGSGT